ncbi:MAG: DUF2238 domain-containing protein [Nanoarchaeota archaeon]|nr:DUF2238 domain-containing protein [Nanoarchaeota archaeon]
MKFKKGEILLALFNLIYILAFIFYYISVKNYEFLLYIGVIVFFFILIATTLRKTEFDYFILIGLSIWGLLHMAGGGIRIGDHVLYGQILIPIINSGDILIFKFDQFVHMFGFGLTSIIGFHLLKPYLNKKINYGVIYFLIVLIGMGFGSLNELVEFFAVVAFPETGVGGYYNTSLDMVFNTIGALIAICVIHFRRKFE